MTIKDLNNMLTISNIDHVCLLPEVKNLEDEQGWTFTINNENSYLPKWLEKLEIVSVEILNQRHYITIKIKLPKDITFNFVKSTIELFHRHKLSKITHDDIISKRDNIMDFLTDNNIKKDAYENIITELKNIKIIKSMINALLII